MGKISIDVNLSKLNKAKFWVDKNGDKHANVDVVKLKQEDQWGKTHFVVEALSKDEYSKPKDQQPEPNFIGKGKEFNWDNNSSGSSASTVAVADQGGNDDDDLPF